MAEKRPYFGYVMDVYWLEQSEADVPTEDDWLSESEAARLNSFVSPSAAPIGVWGGGLQNVLLRLACDCPMTIDLSRELRLLQPRPATPR